MWTETTRRQYRREDLRYASDMTDAEWAVIEPYLPAAKRLGRPRGVALRAVVEALLYLLRTASPWRLLPHDFPNRSTVQRYFTLGRLRAVENHQFPAAATSPRTGRTRGQSKPAPLKNGGRGDRPPIRQDHGKRRPARV
jgi:transposase